MKDLPSVALIAGPTASGKSALALALAATRPATIINADALQVYGELRVLTARPSPQEEAQAPHRLFGHVDAADTGYNAARWAAEAEAAVFATIAEGRLPILVGGTGLYLRTLLDGIAPLPDIDPTVRAQVRALPVAEAHAALTREDPEAAARLRPTDTTRIARALEVVRATGRPLADWQSRREGGIADRVTLAALILLPDRDWLRARCDARLAAMWPEAVEEVRALLARADVPESAPIRRAIGVPEVAAFLAGATPEAAALAAAQAATRQYLKRQTTWLRHQTPAAWTRTDKTQIHCRLQHFETILLQNDIDQP